MTRLIRVDKQFVAAAQGARSVTMLESLQARFPTVTGLLLVAAGAFFAGHTIGKAPWELRLEHAIAFLMVCGGVALVVSVPVEGSSFSIGRGRSISVSPGASPVISESTANQDRRSRPSRERMDLTDAYQVLP